MFDFHISDLATQSFMKSKYYWQNEQAKCCVVILDSSKESSNRPVTISLMQAPPDTEIYCQHIKYPDSTFVYPKEGTITTIGKTIHRTEGKCVRPKGCGRILNSIMDLIDNNSWSFPRAKAKEPYITKEQAELLESMFKSMVMAYDEGNCVYAAVDKAGTMLAERIGIKPDITYQVSHYDMATNTQDDDLISVQTQGSVNLSRKSVLIIDDLISSGRTANAVIQQALYAGASEVKFFALYRTVCSQEVYPIIDSRVEIESLVPLSNAYWTYGRGFDLTDEASRNLKDIYASTKHWDYEDEKDIDDLLEFFGSNYRLSDYK